MPAPTKHPPEEQENEFVIRSMDDDLRLYNLLIVFLRNWALLVCLSLAFGVASAIYTFHQPFTFLAETTVIPQIEQNQVRLPPLLDRLGLANQFEGDSPYHGVETYLAMLESRTFTEEFISNNQLLHDLFPELWNSKTKTWENEEGHPIPPPNKRTDV